MLKSEPAASTDLQQGDRHSAQHLLSAEVLKPDGRRVKDNQKAAFVSGCEHEV